MKFVRWMFVLFFIFAGLIAVYVFAVHKLEVVEQSFENYSEVASFDGIFDRGWIPVWLPKSAYSIRETHDIDSNRSLLIFKFSSEDKFYSACRLVDKSSPDFPNQNSASRLPSYVGEALRQVEGDADFLIYVCHDEADRFLAVNQKESLAYVWRF